MCAVILANGEEPHAHGEGMRLLESADFVVVCDGALSVYRKLFCRLPDLVVGDCDSLSSEDLAGLQVTDGLLERVEDPDHNDLEKAVFALDRRGVAREEMTIVGAGGGREDHLIGNVYRMLGLGVKMITNTGTFYPVRGSLTIETFVDAGVSVFAANDRVRMTSKGLRWPLDEVRFSNPAVATLNRAASRSVTVTSDGDAYLYLPNDPTVSRLVLSLGSNLGDRERSLAEARERLLALPETRLVAMSSVIETEGVDVPDAYRELKFLNQVLLLETRLSAIDFSRRMHAIELEMGRVRTVRNGPRVIDIDLIDFARQTIDTPELQLPHPRARERSFVMEPMRAIGLCERFWK